MFATRFLKKSSFDSYSDYLENGAPIVPENFNFAYDVVDAIAAETPDKIALLWTNDSGERREFSFRELSELSNQTAHVLLSYGLKSGDTVLLFLRRRWEYWMLMMAMHKIGVIPIPSTNQLKSHDIDYRIKMANAKMVIAFDDGYIVNEIVTAGVTPVNCETIMEQASQKPKTLSRVMNKNDDTMVLYFTSGTSAMPKMVEHTFTYPLGHINTVMFWQRLKDNDLHFTLSETGWAKCSWGKMYGQWLCGATVFVYDFAGKFPADALLQVLHQNKINSFCAPPTVYKLVIRDHNAREYLSTITKADVAGEALNPEVFRVFKDLTNVKLHEGFGQTETCVMLFNNEWIEPKPGSTGMPAAGWDIRLLDDRCKEVPDGEVGEICVSLANGKPVGMFKGYYKDDKLNERAFRDGYYHTGDVAYRDADGYFWFVGRNDDLIKSSGYRISPFEIESILTEHPAVKEVAVTGIPDEMRGMTVKATIVLNKYFQGTDSLVSQLQTFVKERTAPYKYPRVIEFVQTLPMTISGKIKRAVIRALDMDKAKK
jgi:acetyl-CoA synthetase